MIEEEPDFDESMVEMGDVEAVLSLTYNIFDYIPELLFMSAYGLLMYAAVLFINKLIKEWKLNKDDKDEPKVKLGFHTSDNAKDIE
tara:strand:- start:108 stop:365 length:258 start_codon:yes stop_codon:yes gene_type:complete